MDDGVWAVFVKHPGEDWKRYSKLYTRKHYAKNNIPYYAEYNQIENIWVVPGAVYVYKLMYAKFDWQNAND